MMDDNLHSDTIWVSAIAMANISYDLHIRNHSYFLWIVTRRQLLQMLHVGIKIVLVQLCSSLCAFAEFWIAPKVLNVTNNTILETINEFLSDHIINMTFVQETENSPS